MNLSFFPAARADIFKQFEYLLKETTPGLRFDSGQVEVAANEAARNPVIGTPVFLRLEGHSEVRSWPFPAIRLYYTQHQKEIHILRVLHGKRDVPRIFHVSQRLP